MTTPASPVRWRRHAGPIASLIVAIVWVGLAWRRPEAHYHFAPLLVTVAWSYGRRWSGRHPLTRGETRVSIAGGALVAAGTALGLQATDHLEGVSFWHSDAVLGEVALMIALGALWGLWVARRPEPGAVYTRPDEVDPPEERSGRSVTSSGR